MSLKIFHICFITISTLLAAGCAWWAFANSVSAAFAWGSVAAAVLMPVYGVWFLKKTRRLVL